MSLGNHSTYMEKKGKVTHISELKEHTEFVEFLRKNVMDEVEETKVLSKF